MKVAVIGLGGIASKAYLPVLGVREDLELQLVSRTAETVHCFQDQYRIPLGAIDLAEVEAWKPDAAFVLTPSPTHFEIARQMLSAGIDVLIEKPATLHAKQTRTLAELADARERILMVGFNRRFAPLHQQARALWANRPLGVAVFQKHRAGAWYTSLEEHFTEDAIHQIDFLRFLCGEGHAVSTQVQMQADRVTGVVSTVALERGGIAVFTAALQAGGWRESYSLHSDQHTLDIDAFEQVRWVTPEGEQRWGESYASAWRTTLEARGFTGQIEHFLDCVQRREQPLTSGWEAVKTQELLEAMLAKTSP